MTSLTSLLVFGLVAFIVGVGFFAGRNLGVKI
jgi:hypothetical protein